MALPLEYAEIPYIYGDGETWLDTGFTPSSYYYSINCKFEILKFTDL